MKKWILVLLATVLVVPTLAHDSLHDVTKDCAKYESGLLKIYLAEHPQAQDSKQAESRLTQCLIASEQRDEAIKMLEKKYATLLADKGKVDLVELLRGCIIPLLYMCFEAGHKDQAKAFMERAEKDWAGTSSAEQVVKTIANFKVRLNTPYLGDSMELKFKALEGREVDLATLKDKVVLVDFWATWCGPCLAELPNVKAAYAKFHDKGFEIIGISLDNDKTKLEEFIKKNDIPWPQSFSGAAWKDPIAQKYGINGIPAMFLIGKDGKVVTTSLRGPGTLEAKLAALLGK
ncbi:MAG: TlpA disulfide reductase family protein [Kiritimatiellaeota bacterium]|nr:TlpA disulfide reductase family protein [Kiritimatiellota bacterium]